MKASRRKKREMNVDAIAVKIKDARDINMHKLSPKPEQKRSEKASAKLKIGSSKNKNT